MAREERWRRGALRPAALWFAFLGPAIAWTLRLLIAYPLVQAACGVGGPWMLHLVSFIFVVVSVAAGVVAWRGFQELRDPAPAAADEWIWGRMRFMALFGLLMAGMFTLVIVAEWIPTFFIHPCTGF
jgi:hypothetical protein